MKKRIFIIFLSLLILLSFTNTKVLAETKIKESIEGRFENYDSDNEYRIEITDYTDKKIVVKFKGTTIIESYAENNKGKLDLRSISKITYYSGNQNYYLYIQYITDSEYQLDYTKEYQYSIYVNDKLESTKRANTYIDKNKGNAKNIYCKFNVEYDRIDNINENASLLGTKVFVVCYILLVIFFIYMKKYGWRYLNAKKYGGIINEKDVALYREVPDDINLEKAYTALYYCTKTKEEKLKTGIIGAFILKWAYEDNISIIDKGNKVFSIDLKDGNFEKSKNEQELYDLLKFVAGENGIIDSTELKEWSRSHRNTLEIWNNKLLEDNAKENLKYSAEVLLGLKRFLLDYSLIDERKHVEVKVWEKYLIYAQLLGISSEVNRQFKKIYPDYSKIGELSTMNMNELISMYIIKRVFSVIPMALAAFISMIISTIYCFFAK